MEAPELSLLHVLAEVCGDIKHAFADFIGMSQSRYQILGLLAQHGEISQAALQHQLGLDGATITRLLKQFEREGLVQRRLAPHDNRYTLASLTAAGTQVVAALSAAHRDFQLRLLTGIAPDDAQRVLRTLEHMQHNLRQVQERRQEPDDSDPFTSESTQDARGT